MAHESFEDEDVARLLNDRFVCVKVDREERPDVDAVYMKAVQSMTGRGGWPMSVFLTPDGQPYYAGTYWPREPGHGMPSFPQVATATAEAWHDRRDEVLESATSIATALAEHREADAAAAVDVTVTDVAATMVLERAWDRQLGGFGRAPKFPQAMTIEWLVARHVRTGDQPALDAAVHSLDAMARGGIHDQLAGGFARYSTDAGWLVPHFEKMLYDNALLLAAYAAAAAVTDDPELVRVTRSTVAYLLSDLVTDDGLLVSATDADSEGVEGRYFVWPYDELTDVLNHLEVDVELWTTFLGAVPGGNWEGVNVLHEPVPRQQFAADRGIDRDTFDAQWEEVRAALLAHRAHRVPPGVDDKVLTDWNAMAVRGLVRAGLLLDQPDWVAAAARTATTLHDVHVVDGLLHHTSKAGRVSVPGFLEDHALLALADLELFQATGETVWFERALHLATVAHERFHDAAAGGWFQTAHDGEALYLRPKETWDNATPAGTSVMVEVCLTLAGLTGDLDWRDRAEQGIRLFQDGARTMATGYGWLLRQYEALAAEPREVAIIGAPGPSRDALARVAHARPYPGTTVVVADPNHGDAVPLLANRGEVDGQPAAYVCRALACERPVVTPDDLDALLDPR